MGTAHTPADLVRDAEDALTAARTAADFITAHPGLPVARMHACGVDGQGRPGPLLEIQLEDGSASIAAAWARTVLGTEPQQEQLLNRVEHRASVQFAGVTVLVTAFEDAAEDDEYDLYDDDLEAEEEWQTGECDNCSGGDENGITAVGALGPLYCACRIGQGAGPGDCVCGPED